MRYSVGPGHGRRCDGGDDTGYGQPGKGLTVNEPIAEMSRMTCSSTMSIRPIGRHQPKSCAQKKRRQDLVWP